MGEEPTNNNTKSKVENKKTVRSKTREKMQEPGPLFSQEDVRRIVTEFVSSWIKGNIVIRFPTAAELSKQNPLSIAFPIDPSINAELEIKEYYVDLLSVCAGIKKASVEEQEKAVSEVFKMLLMFRSANRIEGKISSDDIEKKVEELERTVKNQAKLVDQITGFLFKPKQAKQGSQSQINS